MSRITSYECTLNVLVYIWGHIYMHVNSYFTCYSINLCWHQNTCKSHLPSLKAKQQMRLCVKEWMKPLNKWWQDQIISKDFFFFLKQRLFSYLLWLQSLRIKSFQIDLSDVGGLILLLFQLVKLSLSTLVTTSALWAVAAKAFGSDQSTGIIRTAKVQI